MYDDTILFFATNEYSITIWTYSAKPLHRDRPKYVVYQEYNMNIV